jgi:hypothetical protein
MRGPCPLLQPRQLVPVLEKGLEVRVLAEVSLDLVQPLRDERLEPAFVQVVVDEVETTLGQGGPIIGRRSAGLHGPNGLFFAFR